MKPEFKSDRTGLTELLETLQELPQDAEGPVFKAPWEAQAFAMTLVLHERGVFTWSEWVASLAQVIREESASNDHDAGENYYAHWLVALERITVEKKLVSDAVLTSRKQQLDNIARHTPHGEPIQNIFMND